MFWFRGRFAFPCFDSVVKESFATCYDTFHPLVLLTFFSTGQTKARPLWRIRTAAVYTVRVFFSAGRAKRVPCSHLRVSAWFGLLSLFASVGRAFASCVMRHVLRPQIAIALDYRFEESSLVENGSTTKCLKFGTATWKSRKKTSFG